MGRPWKTILPAPAHGRVLSDRNILIGKLLTFTPVLGLLLAVGLCYPAEQLLMAGAETPPRGASPLLLSWREAGVPMNLLAGGMFALAFLTGAAFAVDGMVHTSRTSDLFFRRLLERAIARRPGAVVNPRSRTAIFVQVVPEGSEDEYGRQGPREVGFLALDYRRNLLLFEGDRERWSIPGPQIIALEVESSTVGNAGQGVVPVTTQFIALSVRDEYGHRADFLLRPHLGTGAFGGGRRRRRARLLMAKIDLLRPPAQRTIVPRLRKKDAATDWERKLRRLRVR